MRWISLSLFSFGAAFWSVSGFAANVGGRCAASPFNSSRRSFLEQAISLVPAFIPVASKAQEQAPSKPFAPLEALLPATRLKLSVDRAHDLSVALTSQSDKNALYDTTVKINEVLSNSPKLFVSETRQQSTGTMAQITTGVSAANKEQYQRNRADLTLPDRLAAMLNQADIERQWGMLRYRESKLEQGDERRRAFNFYTSQLEFGDSYLLTASQEERKRMIRNDQLPTLTTVVTSDLDLRDLYRNQFLTAIDDAQAEVAYQLKQPRDSLDTTDVVDLMNQAHTACTKWFALIDPKDVQEAMDAVMKEQ